MKHSAILFHKQERAAILRGALKVMLVMAGYVFLAPATAQDSSEATYRLYLDADMSHNQAAGNSIKLGIESALSSLNGRLGNHNAELKVLDHRGSSARSKNNITKAAIDPFCLAIIGGMHSPPLLAHNELIHRQQLLTLVPWAAATGITRPQNGENWIFRLSIDDRYAGAKLIDHALAVQGFERPYLLLENTGWGKANEATMRAAIAKHATNIAGVSFFPWGMRQNEALLLLHNALQAKADVIILVANAPEGISLLKAMQSLPQHLRIPIRSHWGITGGDFVQQLGLDTVSQLNLEFLQTYSRLHDEPSHPTVDVALTHLAKVLGKEEATLTDIPAPTGFSHAFDLILLLDAALHQSQTTGRANQDKHTVKHALENLQYRISGLVKDYDAPFSRYHTGSDAHEALGIQSLRMGRFSHTGAIELVPPRIEEGP